MNKYTPLVLVVAGLLVTACDSSITTDETLTTTPAPPTWTATPMVPTVTPSPTATPTSTPDYPQKSPRANANIYKWPEDRNSYIVGVVTTRETFAAEAKHGGWIYGREVGTGIEGWAFNPRFLDFPRVVMDGLPDKDPGPRPETLTSTVTLTTTLDVDPESIPGLSPTPRATEVAPGIEVSLTKSVFEDQEWFYLTVKGAEGLAVIYHFSVNGVEVHNPIIVYPYNGYATLIMYPNCENRVVSGYVELDGQLVMFPNDPLALPVGKLDNCPSTPGQP